LSYRETIHILKLFSNFCWLTRVGLTSFKKIKN
jgi:hypothetical protein